MAAAAAPGAAGRGEAAGGARGEAAQVPAADWAEPARAEALPPPPALLPAVLGALLAAMPERFLPSRGLVSACLELAAALADAWLAAHAVGEAVASGELQRRLEELVGRDCARAWWADAAEHVDPDQEGSPTAEQAPGSGAGGGGRAHARRTLAELMRRSARSVRSAAGGVKAAPPCASSAAAATSLSAARLEFGAEWVVCALDDVMGSVVAHCVRRAAASAAAAAESSTPRPGTGVSGPRPLSSAGDGPRGTQGTQGPRPATPASEAPPHPGTGGGAAFRPPPRGRGAADAVNGAHHTPAEKLRLLGLKHLVAAARGDEELRACSALEGCLVEVSTGVAPHAEVAGMLAVPVYRERLRRWARQEAAAAGGGRPAEEAAVAQALKSTVAALPATGRPEGTSPGRAPPRAGLTGPGPEAAAAAAPRGRRPRGGGWLPKAFVREFNAEGEEVEEAEGDAGEEAEEP